ncbi:MAG: hypothetical protein BWK79_18355 [Beggiatoa sp. IS2]|nr:MAG: hypothetical protein BWK79_18355 [Beggiatoa sp. IS2]
MTLFELKAYLQAHERATLTDMAYHFNSEPDVVAGMLAHWVRKGKVRQLVQTSCHKGCCAGNLPDLYEWVKRKNDH